MSNTTTQKEFFDGWLQKSETYNEQETAGAFDKFFTLFVLFNALYNEATDRLLIENKITKTKKDIGDRNGATKNTILFIGADNLYLSLKNKCGNEIDKVAGLIEDKTFYFHMEKGTTVPDNKKDQECVDGIRSGNKQKYCDGILQLIYQTRCNMFHGSKQFDIIQVKLLSLFIKIVTVLIDELRDKLYSY